jgi:hypothetical protein
MSPPKRPRTAKTEPAEWNRDLRSGSPIRPEKSPVQLREELLTKKEERRKLPLKRTGKLMDVGLASAAVAHLRMLLEEHPSEFQALIALTEGRTAGISPATITMLHESGYIQVDGSPLPVVAEALQAAYRSATPDGPCIVDALDLKTEEDAAMVARFEERREKGVQKKLDRLLQDLLREPDDDDRSRR